MSLIKDDLFSSIDLVANAIALLREHEPNENYYLAFSGGKDSIVIKDLADRAGVKYDAHYNMTTVDPPEIVQFIRDQHPDVKIDRPKENMFALIVRKQFPPLRQARFCCAMLKESAGEDRTVMTGIRRQESTKRNKRKAVEQSYINETVFYVHPIIDWTKEDVWEYIHSHRLPYCSLYDEGYDRLGCVLCPYNTPKNRLRDAKRWPKIANLYRKACIKAHNAAIAAGKERRFKDGNEMFEWWLSGKRIEADAPLLNMVEGR